MTARRFNMRTYSIIIPCYNEEKRIVKTLGKIKAFLYDHIGSEAIFIDDGSKDNTANIIMEHIRGWSSLNLRLVKIDKNQGKWSAIRMGVLYADKDYWVTCDADYSIDLHQIDQLRLDDGVTIGDRYLGNNKIPFNRRVPGRVFNFLVRALVGIKYGDSQTPFKVVKNDGNALRVIFSMQECGFAGDVEFLRLCDVYSVPVRPVIIDYDAMGGSSVNVRKHAPRMFWALFRIRRHIYECDKDYKAYKDSKEQAVLSKV
jgi:dolichyl-phosphate beta-glucosyltransferase